MNRPGEHTDCRGVLDLFVALMAVLWEWQGQAAKVVDPCKEALSTRRAFIFDDRDDPQTLSLFLAAGRLCAHDHIIQN